MYYNFFYTKCTVARVLMSFMQELWYDKESNESYF